MDGRHLVLDLRGLVQGWRGTRMSGAGLATGSFSEHKAACKSYPLSFRIKKLKN